HQSQHRGDEAGLDHVYALRRSAPFNFLRRGVRLRSRNTGYGAAVVPGSGAGLSRLCRNSRRSNAGAVYAASAARLQKLYAVTDARAGAASAAVGGADLCSSTATTAADRIVNRYLSALRRDAGSHDELLQSMRTPAAWDRVK